VARRIRSIEQFNDIGNRTRDLPACSIVPQPTSLTRAPTLPVRMRFILKSLRYTHDIYVEVGAAVRRKHFI
jgi:hypothetical protein